jgi:PAS domain S-box-containing protein
MASENTSIISPVSRPIDVVDVLPDPDKIVESVGELVAATDLDGTLTYANREFLRKLAISANPLDRLKTKLEILSPVSFLTINPEVLSETLELGSWTGECELLCQDGGTLPVRLKTGRIPLENGAVVGIHYIATDLTEKRENERQLQLLSSIVQCSGSALVGLTTRGIVFSWNKEAELLFGYPARDILGRSGDVLLPFDRRNEGAALLERLNRGERIQNLETVRIRRDGAVLHVSIAISPILDRNGYIAGSSMAVRDISETRTMQTQLKHALKFESTGRLAGGVAHEFNNMHSVILGYCDILSEMPSLDQRTAGYVEQIRKAAQQAATVTQQLLAFSQKQILDPRVIDLGRAVKGMEGLLKNMVGDDVELVIRDSSSGCHVNSDPSQIEQVIMKLASNGREAMPRGGTLSIGTENVVLADSYILRHAYALPGEYCLLTIKDTGVGMDEATQASIFDPFFTAKGQGPGTDFGLAVVYGIVKQSGGFIDVESGLGTGTTFNIYLPKTNQPVSPPSARSPLMDLPRGTETILLVDDNETFRKMNRILIERFGYTVLEAANGTEAMELAQRFEGSIDLLLTDVVMPGMDGPTLASRMKDIRPDIKILYMSGYSSALLTAHVGQDSAIALLVKPFSRSTLALKLREGLSASAQIHMVDLA